MQVGELGRIKRDLSPRLLAVEGVSGVGTPHGVLTVYLSEDSPFVRERVNSILEHTAPDTPISYVQTGSFRLQ